MSKVLVDRELLAGLVSNDRETRLDAERRMYGVLANQPAEAEGVEVRLRRVIDELKAGFVVCQRCGDQEDTETLDCVTELESISAALSAVTAERDALRKAAWQHPFAQKVIKKLRRFEECAEDSGSGGVDIGRHWLDVLTQLGLLNRVQRSPACWEITAQGEDVLAAMAAKEG